MNQLIVRERSSGKTLTMEQLVEMARSMGKGVFIVRKDGSGLDKHYK